MEDVEMMVVTLENKKSYSISTTAPTKRAQLNPNKLSNESNQSAPPSTLQVESVEITMETSPIPPMARTMTAPPMSTINEQVKVKCAGISVTPRNSDNSS
eukprot:CAMPEP_0197029802 /NCGR_PEP_ID=MMETSP1384-20130603/9177_1 /TAXON_ID=29189 /ORGANISM="Ammonia sp." /LENGTH=99 /DNA_ID=CAMNT_0042459039 /DNA_START=209 /DNA_END=508 /DNA_ORIENTATION=-